MRSIQAQVWTGMHMHMSRYSAASRPIGEWSELMNVSAYVCLSVRAHIPRNHITTLEGKYSLESTDPRESEIRAHLRP